MKKNTLPVLIIVGLIVIVLIFIGVSAVIDALTPTTERANLTEYYEIENESQVAIVLDNEVLDSYATRIDGEVYLDFRFIYNNLSSRFYWDSNENILLYTTSNTIFSAEAEATSYMKDKDSINYGKTLVKATADSAWVHIDFIKELTNIRINYHDNPGRIVITKTWGQVNVASAKEVAYVREKNHIKSPILSDLEAGTSVTILDSSNNWYKVATADGFIGYVESQYLTEAKTEQLISEKPAETFDYRKLDKPFNLLWHQTMNTSANAKISSILSKSKGVNVISPTWFKIKDNNGNISSIAAEDYVKYCHSQGVQVWGLVSNFEVDDVDSSYVLTHTSTRHNLVNQLIAKALQYDLDGINVDFESMNGPKVRDAYIQFLRELSTKCEDNDLVLSTDVPVPAPYNDFYSYGEQSLFVDYVIIMGYDEHYGQKTGAGSVASLDWTEEAVQNMLEEGVPSNQIVLGMPFYTKLWSLTPKSEENSPEVTYVIGFENLGMNSAQNWMNNNVDEPTWLEDCGQYYGEATKKGVIYKMWLEDTTSLEKRLQLMKSYNLAGAAFWKSGLEVDKVWDLIIKYIN